MAKASLPLPAKDPQWASPIWAPTTSMGRPPLHLVSLLYNMFAMSIKLIFHHSKKAFTTMIHPSKFRPNLGIWINKSSISSSPTHIYQITYVFRMTHTKCFIPSAMMTLPKIRPNRGGSMDQPFDSHVYQATVRWQIYQNHLF